MAIVQTFDIELVYTCLAYRDMCQNLLCGIPVGVSQERTDEVIVINLTRILNGNLHPERVAIEIVCALVEVVNLITERKAVCGIILSIDRVFE